MIFKLRTFLSNTLRLTISLLNSIHLDFIYSYSDINNKIIMFSIRIYLRCLFLNRISKKEKKKKYPIINAKHKKIKKFRENKDT